MNKIIELFDAFGIPPLPSKSPDAITTLVWARDVLQQHLNNTYVVKSPKGIEELKSIEINGTDQWLHIRGRNRNNPILLFLHGGPGFPMIGFMDAIQRPWEDYFTVVHWDQRQTGKSYYPADDVNKPISIAQMIKDSEEVLKTLRHHLKQDKLFLLGHSWGSVLGVHMAKRHPEWLHAYIGVGQVVNMMDNERALYERLKNYARGEKEKKLMTKLEDIAPYPDPNRPGQSFVENGIFLRSELSRLGNEVMMRHLSWHDVNKMISLERLMSPHLTLTDLALSISGGEAALFRPPYCLAKEFMDIDLPNDLGSDFEVPIFFFTGAHDWQVSHILSEKWFSQIESPHKELIKFQESCHMIVNEEPGKVLTALVSKVLPVSVSDSEHGKSYA